MERTPAISHGKIPIPGGSPPHPALHVYGGFGDPFIFMTMPIGTIIRLTREQALKWGIGCLNNLYESIENLDDKHPQSEKCKEMLLCPRSAAEIYSRNLKLDFVDSNSNEYYVCGSGCTLSPYKTARCHCGNHIGYMVKLKNPVSLPGGGGVFVKPTARFMITDDFQVLPMSTMTCLTLLKELGAVDGSTIKERCINIGKDEVLKLINCSLTSMAHFSETVLESPVSKTSCAIRRVEFSPRSTTESQSGVDTTRSKEAKIALKLIINKCNNKALYAEAEKDFVDLICSFLTFPLDYMRAVQRGEIELPAYCNGQEDNGKCVVPLICYENVAYHRPDLCPKQFGIKRLKKSALPVIRTSKDYESIGFL
ncbi:uncharacterized protein LOC132295907 [Cornus florida]|uniref:uncharacterized protein LOC132295907 n=1 Tax=Cornus florida TaxID=4283 RepID=UPI00289B6B77|nr:uncharacterized protein LOC132295907 [Cornus florida]